MTVRNPSGIRKRGQVHPGPDRFSGRAGDFSFSAQFAGHHHSLPRPADVDHFDLCRHGALRHSVDNLPYGP